MSTTMHTNMYKTVRHGENSLQYKILAQQEEGATHSNLKYKKTRNRKIFGVIAIVLILVCGIIASAVLIPLLLANDFITLTGTFQKFSVSTLRRTHTGNHVVVIAKKPHGWSGSRQSFLQSNQLSNSSLFNSHIIRKENSTEKVSGTKDQKIVSLNNYLKTSSKPRGIFFKDKSLNHLNDETGNSVPTPSTKSLNFDILLVSSKNSKDCTSKTTPLENIPTQTPFWKSGKKWSFESSTNFAEWVKSRVLSHSVVSALGLLMVVTFIITVFVLLIKNSFSHKKHLKEFIGHNEDKTELLKSQARGSDEE